MSDERFIGTAVRVDSSRRFGFIKRDDGKRDVFVHEHDLPDGERLVEGMRLVASIGTDPYGRKAAKKVQVIEHVASHDTEPAPRGYVPATATKASETAGG